MLDKMSSQAYYDVGKLGALKGRAKNDLNENTVKEVARQFESLFVRMMLKSMREASIGDPIFGGKSSEMYRDMFDQQLSVSLSAQGGFGLSKMLEKFMSRQMENATGGVGDGATENGLANKVSLQSNSNMEKKIDNSVLNDSDAHSVFAKETLENPIQKKKVNRYLGIYR